MQLNTFILLTILAIGLPSCSSNSQSIELSCVEDLDKIVLNPFKDLNKTQFLLNRNLLDMTDSVFLGDDQVEWNGKCFYLGDDLIFIVENNWTQKDSISTIQILSPLLRTKKMIGVNSTFGDIIDHIDFDTWKNFPDGYLMFKDKSNSKLVYEFESSDSIDLGNMPLDISTFPKKLRITAILFVK